MQKAYEDYLNTGNLPNWMELFTSDLFSNIFAIKWKNLNLVKFKD